ncbi:MAG: hypothetical protein ACM3JD_15670, partial [Rudaea sp.]
NVLEDTLADLRGEIGRTDDYSYRSMLKEREAVLNKILSALDAQYRAATGPVQSSGPNPPS